ncbi:UNVERIFIED_CONTAM: hypothetical protein GTU68_009596 [Idotea baltica]|nr:hypothetical protein [Idotea baltica]
MCGITGYIGYRDAYPIVINGLKRLEYRGYDSAGIMMYDGKQIHLSKTKGKVSDLETITNKEIERKVGKIGIGHTRWATHGVPNDVNSHPHFSQSGDLVIVHNGIIENYDTLRKELISRGYSFKSDTDTEVLINLIEEVKKQEKCKLGQAVQLALNNVIGAYAIAVFDKTKPNEIVIARLGSPIAIGVGKDNSEFFVASDASPFVEYTKDAIYLEDEEMAIIKLGKDIKVRRINDDSLVDAKTQELQMSLEQIEKGGYDHFMLKEIYEQPKAIVEALLKIDEKVKEIAEVYKDAKNCLYLGRGFNFPVALEGALKLKEISYIHAEGYPAAEMKHGPIALIDENMPIFVIATNKGHYEKVVSNIQEIKSRAGKIIAVVTEGDVTVKEIADHVIEIPETEEAFTPLLTTIPFQLLSYHIAVLLGKNVDQPRNLAKSVTVE